ncbi:MAG: 2-dehydropantoate 2-reductase [Deltaproteobacteria bacterium]|nr:2-dehydropantoate 2-reductase [Deltaproteobacteria bacterium]
MKIAVLGPGALGCLLAASLKEQGEEVVLLDYRPQRRELLQRRGITVHTLAGEVRVAPVPVALAAAGGAFDLVVVAVKAYQTEAAAGLLPRLLAPGALVLTVQNGLGNLEALAAAVGPERLLAGVVFAGATRPEEGRVVHAGAGPTVIGAPPGSQVTPARLAQVAQVFRRAGWECRIRDDIEVVLWEKLLVNVGINPLTALLRVPNGVLPAIPPAWELAVAAATEAAALARASGLALTVDPDTRLREVCAATAANLSSMLQDVLAGRPTEIAALNGQVVARAKTHGLPTPVNYCLTRLLEALEAAAPSRPSAEKDLVV